MAFLLLFSTLSFAVEMHFCGKVLVDKAIFSETQSCCSESDAPEEDPCCNEENISIEGQDELKISFNQLDLGQKIFLKAFAFSFIDLFEGLSEQAVPFKDYSPPLLVSNIQLLNQTFLI